MAATVPAPIESEKPLPSSISSLDLMNGWKPDYPLGYDLLKDEKLIVGGPPLAGQVCRGIGAARSADEMFPKVRYFANEFVEEVARKKLCEVTKYFELDTIFYNGTTNGLANSSRGGSTASLKKEKVVVLGANSSVSVERLDLEWSEMPPPLMSDAEYKFVLDSGASVHVTGKKTLLKDYMPLTQAWKIAVADGRLLDVIGIGSIITPEGRFHIPNVFYVEGLKENLVSVSVLDKHHGLFNCFHKGICEIIQGGGELVGGGFLKENGQYELRFLLVPENAGV